MEDQKIIQLYWDRDEGAIPATADKYGGYCASIAHSILSDPQDAEECVNDTWLAAWNAMPPHRPAQLSTFLGKLTRNLSFNRWKARRADKRGGGQLPMVLDELGECVSGREDVEGEVDRKELARAIGRFLSTLPGAAGRCSSAGTGTATPSRPSPGAMAGRRAAWPWT